MKILFTGGGTGGHVLPIVAVAREMRRIYQGKDLQFFYIGPKDEFGEILLSQENIKIKNVLSGKIRRYQDWKSISENLVDVLFKIPIGILQAFFHIFFLAPDLILSKGGFGSIPGVIAGWLLRVQIILHESDVAPGLAHRILSKLVPKVFVSFPRTEYFPLKKMILVGNPIRREVLGGSREEAKRMFNLQDDKPIILILGGSQGAQRINDKILEILSKLVKDFEIIHQTGWNNFKEVKAEAKVVMPKGLEQYYHPFPFLREEELKRLYQAADLIVSRAGSGSIFEIAALAKPSILVPLPDSAQSHQVKNAYAYAENKACLVMEEPNFTPRFFLEKLKYLFSRPEELEQMQKAAQKFAKPMAAKALAGHIINCLTK